jgi:hypothetical protein
MSKTAFEVGEIAGGALLAATGFGAITLPAVWGITAGELSTMASLGVGVGLSGTFGLLQTILTPQDTAVAGSQANLQNSAAYRRVCYGIVEVGGVLTYDSAPSGSGNYQNQGPQANWRHQVYTVAAHQITAFGKGGKMCVVIDNVLTTLEDIGSGYYAPDNNIWPYGGNDGPHILFEFDTGNPGATTAFPNLSAACPDWNPGVSVQRGCAKVHVAMKYDCGADGSEVGNSNGPYPYTLQTSEPVFVSGRVPNFRFPLVGKPIVDTRVSGGSNTPDGTWLKNTKFAFAQFVMDGNSRVEAQMTQPSGITGNSIPAWAEPGDAQQDNQCSWLDAGPIIGGGWPGPNRGVTYPYVFTDPNGNLQMLLNPGSDDGIPLITQGTEPTWGQPGQETGDGEYFIIKGMPVGRRFTWLCLGAPTTYGAAANPSNNALCVYDWLTSPTQEYGMGVDPDDIDIDSVNAAANICDETVTVCIAANGQPIKEYLYSCNGIFDYGTERVEVLKALVASMAGTIVPPGDEWHLQAGSYNAPSTTLTDADLRGPIKGDFRLSRRDTCNGVRGQFMPSYIPTNTTEAQPGTWRSTDFPPYQGNGLQGHPNWIQDDGGQIIWKDVRLSFTSSLWTAQRLAKIILQTIRHQVTLHLACKLSAYRVRAGDTVTFIHDRWNGLSPAPPTTFLVTSVTLVLTHDGDSPTLGVDLILRETNTDVWDFDIGEYSQYGTLGVY